MSKLQELRRTAKLSQQALADKVGFSVHTLRQYEQGTMNVDGMALGRAFELARALGVHAEDLLDDTGPR